MRLHANVVQLEKELEALRLLLDAKAQAWREATLAFELPLQEAETWAARVRREQEQVSAVPDELQAVSRVEVGRDGVLAVQEREDHRLVTVSMQWSFQRLAAPFHTHASGASFADRAKLRLSAVRDFIEQEWCNTPPLPPQWTPEAMERVFAQRGRQVFAKACPKSGPRNDWTSEETWSALCVHGRLRSIFFRDVRRRQALVLKCVLARWRASKDSEAEMWKAACDRLCRADDAVSRSIRLQIFAFHETSKEAACLVKCDRIAWMSEQTKHIAGQLVLGRTTPLWQLVRRISGRKRMGPRLVAALTDVEGKVISTPEAGAAM